MQFNKFLFGLFLLSTGCYLTACHNSNKLLTTDKKQAAKFIYQAEWYAEVTTSLYDSTGSAYIACVYDPTHFDNPFVKNYSHGCDRFFKAMLDYAKRDVNYSNLTLYNLKDKAVAARLNDELFIYESTAGEG
ncbi:MAG: hypothetical protein A3E87_06610 [Gammaproteobacteria bacterium RIFCSPHIGHO2_12_FULL_35_23]|nr:MAG: hypothetical protein A3E87_06610 [Gammaproteobacteria bacterium RIFCSPHIGHO2_12_FULL_35_23]